MTQDLSSFPMTAPLIHDGYGTLPHFNTDGNSSFLASLLIEGGYDNATIPHFNIVGNSSIMPAPYIQGGYTSLLLGVDQDATLQSTARKLHFAEGSSHENM